METIVGTCVNVLRRKERSLPRREVGRGVASGPHAVGLLLVSRKPLVRDGHPDCELDPGVEHALGEPAVVLRIDDDETPVVAALDDSLHMHRLRASIGPDLEDPEETPTGRAYVVDMLLQ